MSIFRGTSLRKPRLLSISLIVVKNKQPTLGATKSVDHILLKYHLHFKFQDAGEGQKTVQHHHFHQFLLLG